MLGRDSDSDRDEAEASDDDMMDEVDDNGGRRAGRGGGGKGSKKGSRTASPDPAVPTPQKKDGEHPYLQSGAATCSEGFVKCYLRVPQAVGLYCSCHAAQASKGNFQKTCNKTFRTCCRPRLHIRDSSVLSQGFVTHFLSISASWWVYEAVDLLNFPDREYFAIGTSKKRTTKFAAQWMGQAVQLSWGPGQNSRTKHKKNHLGWQNSRTI